MFEGEEDSQRALDENEKNKIVLSEIDKKEQFMAQLTPYDENDVKDVPEKINNEQQFIKMNSVNKQDILKIGSIRQNPMDQNVKIVQENPVSSKRS